MWLADSCSEVTFWIAKESRKQTDLGNRAPGVDLIVRNILPPGASVAISVCLHNGFHYLGWRPPTQLDDGVLRCFYSYVAWDEAELNDSIRFTDAWEELLRVWSLYGGVCSKSGARPDLKDANTPTGRSDGKPLKIWKNVVKSLFPPVWQMKRGCSLKS